jgi:2-C-methyl-D-erythritol 4-phosphate cytidylyltransferase/2-C-methyl-D-erythritol 2,4-cyclodiphosphate synthase
MARGPKVCAVVLAGGSGRRAGRAKQFARAAGRSLLYHACRPFLEAREVGGLVLVVPPGRGPAVTEEMDDMGAAKVLAVVNGGATRQASSRAGLAALPPACEIVLVHDAARPFAAPALIRRVLRGARAHGACVPAVPVADATIEVDEAGDLRSYLDRGGLRAVQTPQGFSRGLLEEAFAAAGADDAVDDAALVRALGRPVHLVPGDPDNAKITSAGQLRDAVSRLEAAWKGGRP